jgi:DNA-binding NarL/FixJ family response regulator
VPEILPADMIADDTLQSNNQFITGCEHDALSGLLAGSSNKEIARNLNLSEVTIKHHLKSLRSKLGARNRTRAVCRAIELGIR